MLDHRFTMPKWLHALKYAFRGQPASEPIDTPLRQVADRTAALIDLADVGRPAADAAVSHALGRGRSCILSKEPGQDEALRGFARISGLLTSTTPAKTTIAFHLSPIVGRPCSSRSQPHKEGSHI